MGEALKGDYLGFTYNGRHSSDFGIVRTSNGSRFDENLLPTMQDKTVQVQGGDGAYYFGSQYTQRVFNISFAFDSMDEQKLEQLRRHFGDKKIHDLIFDERPYKIYSAKVTGTATLKYIPFEEGETGRLYKGEGSITFTCYDPFARSRYKFLEEYNDTEFPNKNEWAAASRMLPVNGGLYDTYNNNTHQILLHNPGDKEAHFELIMYFLDYTDSTQIPAGRITLKDSKGENILAELEWEAIKRVDSTKNTLVIFNSKTNLIEGASGSDKKRSGTIFNEHIKLGDFFSIPIGTYLLEFSGDITTAEIDPSKGRRTNIKYDYYYL